MSRSRTFETNRDSLVADDFFPSYGYRSDSYAPRNDYAAVVVHTTGCGPVVKWKKNKDKFASPFEAALDAWNKMPVGTHYAIGQGGECTQLCPERLAAWHVGSSRGRSYNYKSWNRSGKYDWWFERWKGFESPKQLADERLWQPYAKGIDVPWKARWRSHYHGSVNANTVGIEIVPPSSNPRGPWSERAWLSLVRLVQDICRRRNIPIDRLHVLSHSDCNPRSRTTNSGRPWDPGTTQWSYGLFHMYQKALEARGLL